MGKEKILVERVSSNEQFEQCMDVTRGAWEETPEIEQIPTHIMKASARTGQFFVASTRGEIIGYSMSFAQLPDTLYLHAIGVSDDHKSKGVGEKIMTEMKKDAINSGFNFITMTYAPLLGNNAKLYIHKMGGTVDTFEEDAYCKTFNKSTGGESPTDRFLGTINLNDSEGERHNLRDMGDVLDVRVNDLRYEPDGIQTFPITPRKIGKYGSIEIPHSLDSLKEAGSEAETRTVLQFRDIFKENLENGRIVDFLSFMEKGHRKNFYILKN